MTVEKGTPRRACLLCLGMRKWGEKSLMDIFEEKGDNYLNMYPSWGKCHLNIASFHSKYFMATEVQFTSNKHTNILGGLEICPPVTPLVLQLSAPALISPSATASAETEPGLRVVTQFRHTASHLGPQAPNYSTALAVWFMFIYIYIYI